MTKKIYGFQDIGMRQNNVKKRVLKSIQPHKKRNWLLSLAALLIIAAFASFLYSQIQQNSLNQATETPLNDEISIEVRTLSDNEYDLVGNTDSIIEVSKNDFRVVHFNYVLKKDKGIRVLKLELSHFWNEIFSEIDGIERYWFGEYAERNNDNERESELEATMTIFVRGLAEQDVKEHLKHYALQLAWHNGTEVETEEIILANHLAFKGRAFLTEQAKAVQSYEKPLSSDFGGKPAYEIGANKEGKPVFVNMEAALQQAKIDFRAAFLEIEKVYDLGEVKTDNWQRYKKSALDFQASNIEIERQAVEIAKFFDIYENSLQ